MRIGMVVLITFLGAAALGWWWAAVNIYSTISCPMGGDCYVTPEWARAVPLAVIVGGAAALIVLGAWAVLRRFRPPA
jgi:hypothetical protein